MNLLYKIYLGASMFLNENILAAEFYVSPITTSKRLVTCALHAWIWYTTFFFESSDIQP
jgi:hypothetical protein